MTYHDDPDRALPQAFAQPGKPGAYLHRKITLQDALPGVEQHVIMPITDQLKA
jgi:hypothetical protein